MKKYKIAFVKFAGLAAGGSEIFLQTIAANLPKNKFVIDYFYTNAAPYIGSDYKHSDNDPNRKKYLEEAGINLIPVNVGFKDITQPHHPWIDTNFFDLFDESKYDVITTVRAGHREFPLCDLKNKPMVEIVTLPGLADNQSNIVKSIHISEYQKQTWINAGGNANKSVVLPIISEKPELSSESMHKELNIKSDDFIFGFHQRVDDGIYSPVSLEAYKHVMNENTWFIIMGGSSLYSQFAKQHNLKNFIQLSHSGDPKILNKFLNTIDVMAHARKDGETFSNAIAEAMSHGLPILSHVAPAMGHVETIGDAGYVCKTIEEYVQHMKELMEQNPENERCIHNAKYNLLNKNAVKRYQENFSKEIVMKKIIKIYEDAANTKMHDDMTDEEFWNSID